MQRIGHRLRRQSADTEFCKALVCIEAGDDDGTSRASGDRATARERAARACALHRSPESLAAAALAALADRDFPTAGRQWRAARAASGTPPAESGS